MGHSGKHRSQEVGKINKRIRQREKQNKKKAKNAAPTTAESLELLMKQRRLI